MASVACLPGSFWRQSPRSCAHRTLREALGSPPGASSSAHFFFSADRGENAHVRLLPRSWPRSVHQRQWSTATASRPLGLRQHGASTACAGLAADRTTVVTSCSPLESLEKGQWVKLICGASFEDVLDIRNLALVYTLAGVDCIDCAASPAIVAAVHEGIEAAYQLLHPSEQAGPECRSGSAAVGFRRTPLSPRPWVMVSVSDSDDPHFRKAAFDPELCPADCRRPCEIVCPTAAISFKDNEDSANIGASDGVELERCYGCGRCVPACPYHLIRTESYQRSLDEVGDLLQSPSVDAIEIHTLPGHLLDFAELWRQIGRHAGSLKLVAVSTPDQGPDMDEVMRAMYDVMAPDLKKCPNLWQLDGRPMSGDLGAATAKAAVKLAGKVLAWEERPPGFLQLAGGTNEHSFRAMDAAGIRIMRPQDTEQGFEDDSKVVHGIAFGGSARSQLAGVLQKLHENADSQGTSTGGRLENDLQLLGTALQVACRLVDPFKTVK